MNALLLKTTVSLTLLALALPVLALPVLAQQVSRSVLREEYPARLNAFSISPGGNSLLFTASNAIFVLDPEGRVTFQFPAYAPRAVFTNPDGGYLVFESYSKGRIVRFRADGSEERVLVTRQRQSPAHLRPDGTGWTSPTGGAVDWQAGLIFALDTTSAPKDDRNLPDPDWSRIALFDLSGTFVREIHAFSAYPDDKRDNDDARTWFDGIALDPERQRVYITARRFNEVRAYAYDGTELGRQVGLGPVAVFPDGRVATLNAAGNQLLVYTPAAFDARASEPATPVISIPAPAGIEHLATDPQGQLYASMQDSATAFIRWSADLSEQASVGPSYRRIHVTFPPETAVEAGSSLRIGVTLEQRGAPASTGETWHVFMRPTDGSSLLWQPLDAIIEPDHVTVQLPAAARGGQELAVRFGGQEPPRIGDPSDLHAATVRAVREAGAIASISIVPDSLRTAYIAGETIPFHIIARPDDTRPPLLLRLDRSSGEPVFDMPLPADASFWTLPASLTRRLTPGSYHLTAMPAESAEGFGLWPLRFSIRQREPDSPMQRIIYQQFGETSPFDLFNKIPRGADQSNFLRMYANEMVRLGFTRQTSREGGTFLGRPPSAWNPVSPIAELSHPALPPSSLLRRPSGNWAFEYYLDLAVERGLAYDTQMLVHCGGVRVREHDLNRYVSTIQHMAQWLGRFPSFLGFNYNDEMFFGGWAPDWTADDSKWFAHARDVILPGRPRADVLRYALRTMYDAFNDGVRQVRSDLTITTTPMWQFPAVEGSYAPEIYKDMTETYSHYLGEGFHFPWYPAHSINFLKRPGLPIMGVFDNFYGYRGSDLYMVHAMQVLGQGIQGMGVGHTHPWQDPMGADSYRVANLFAKRYGPVYAELGPAYEGSILYSYTQDIAERRNALGTPHWERVFELHSAALMAGIPLNIVYETDLASGLLLNGRRPAVPMVFLVGQRERLPEDAENALKNFVAAGGRLFEDAASAYGAGSAKPAADAPLPVALDIGQQRLDVETHALRTLYIASMDADSQHPMTAPVLEALSVELRNKLGAYRRFPIDSSNPWVAPIAFPAGQATYIHLSTDPGEPLPFTPGEAWSLGVEYRKTVTPKTAHIEFPDHEGVVYDVFNRELIDSTAGKGRRTVKADLRTFPGQLLALLPHPVGTPTWDARIEDDGQVSLTVQMQTDRGRALKMNAPLRIRLYNESATAWDFHRGTDVEGALKCRAPLPTEPGPWTLEVTEMISGQRASAQLTGQPSPVRPVPQPAVQVHREEALLNLLNRTVLQGHPIRLVGSTPAGLTNKQRTQFVDYFRSIGADLTIMEALPDEPEAALYVIADVARAGRLHVPVLAASAQAGLWPVPISQTLPGTGMGIVTALFAPRGSRHEHVIALLGGDAAGLAAAITRFTSGDLKTVHEEPSRPETTRARVQGREAERSTEARVRDLTGVSLTGLTVTPDGSRMAVTAKGYLGNLALIEDRKDHAVLLQAHRIGDGPHIAAPWIAADGGVYGASVRTLDTSGNSFVRLESDAPASATAIAAFGDRGRTLRSFGLNATGDRVVAPGHHGVIGWKQETDGAWREVWGIDYWKDFDQLKWPVSNEDERNPTFHALIPRDGEHALLTFSEKVNQGWIKPEHPGKAHIRSVRVSDGQEAWRFDVPVQNQLLFPTLYSSTSGRHLLLQVMVGSWRQDIFRFYRLDDAGRLLSQWQTGQGMNIDAWALNDASGLAAISYSTRMIELRRPDGSIRWGQTWSHRPVSMAFSDDGRLLLLSDDAGNLTALDSDGRRVWQAFLGTVSQIAVSPMGIVAAGWDGRVRAYALDGTHRWTLDSTEALVAAMPVTTQQTVRAERAPTTEATVPGGDNLLTTGQAILTLGGTPGWKSQGKVLVETGLLTNGVMNDVDTPWLPMTELYWSANAGRQVWAQIDFPESTDVGSLTIYEHPDHPESFPDLAVVQIWREEDLRWITAKTGVFMRGSVNTYPLNLQNVTRLRYVPLSSYYRNLFISEIEVRR